MDISGAILFFRRNNNNIQEEADRGTPFWEGDHCRIQVNVFFVGIGGARLNALAKLYADRGYQVAGSDRQASKTTEELIARGSR